MGKKNKHSGRTQVIYLGGAFLFQRIFNVITPIFLVRLLDVSEYGEYQFFWLVANTVHVLAPLGMPASLLYFVPRLKPEEVPQFISQTILWLMATGTLAAIAVSPWSPFIPDTYSAHHGRALTMSGFVLLWLVSSLIEVLPSADRRVAWQAGAIVWLTLFRNLIVIAAAYFTRSLDIIFLALLAFMFLKMLVLGVYCARYHGPRFFTLKMNRFREQLNYAFPFGIADLINGLRSKIEQWMVALLFLASDFGIFSIALTVQNLLSMLRKSIGQVITPRMSKSELDADYERTLSLNNRGNIAVSAIVFPAVAFLYAFVSPVITLLYTEAYLQAVPVLRIYLLGTLLTAVEVSTLLVIFRQGKFVMRINSAAIVVSLILSYAGAKILGMEGVAVGSVVTLAISKIINFVKASELMDVPLRKLQNWGALLALFVASLLAAVISYYLASLLPDTGGLILHLIGAVLLFSILYLAIIFLAGYGDIVSAIAGRKKFPDNF